MQCHEQFEALVAEVHEIRDELAALWSFNVLIRQWAAGQLILTMDILMQTAMPNVGDVETSTWIKARVDRHESRLDTSDMSETLLEGFKEGLVDYLESLAES